MSKWGFNVAVTRVWLSCCCMTRQTGNYVLFNEALCSSVRVTKYCSKVEDGKQVSRGVCGTAYCTGVGVHLLQL